MKQLKQIFTFLKNILTSPLAVAGLEISQTSLKYLLVKNQTIVQASVRLPAGILEHGVVKDRKNLVAALKNLHTQIAPLGKSITVILGVPSTVVFTQAFSVPIVNEQHLEESIKLNLQMISPNKIEDSYYDWQEIKTNKDLGHIDLLGAFGSRHGIDEFTSAVKEANFNPIAVEFPGLALARLISQRWNGLDESEHYLVIYVSGEGVLLLILKNGNVFFNHFTPWSQAGVAGEPTSFIQIREFLTQELERVLNFYMGRSGKTLNEAILISPVFNYEIVTIVSQKLGLKIRNLTITELPKLQPNWFPVLGTGLRGIIPRSRDTEITLATTNAQTEYYEERTLLFIKVWRNIIIGALVCMFGAFILVDTLVAKEQTRLKTKINTEFSVQDMESSQTIQTQITAFNHQLDFIEKTAGHENAWSPFIDDLKTLAGTDIALNRILADKNNLKAVVSGQAVSEQAAINFKNRLIADPHFSNISLPLSNLSLQADKSVNFSLSFTITSIP